MFGSLVCCSVAYCGASYVKLLSGSSFGPRLKKRRSLASKKTKSSLQKKWFAFFLKLSVFFKVTPIRGGPSKKLWSFKKVADFFEGPDVTFLKDQTRLCWRTRRTFLKDQTYFFEGPGAPFVKDQTRLFWRTTTFLKDHVGRQASKPTAPSR